MGIKLYHNGQWVEFSGSYPVGSAAGNNKQVQFNDNGALAGANQLEFDKGDTSVGEANLILKPNNSTVTYGGGNIVTQTNDASDNFPYSKSMMTADGGLELTRRRTAAPAGGPYLDFKSQVVSGTEQDMDARIQMDYALESGSVTPTSTDYSDLTFQTGGRGYYDNPSNTSGNVTEKFRITKSGDFVCGITTNSSGTGEGDINHENTVRGGGIYNRVRYMGDPSKSDNENVYVTKDFFTLNSIHGAMAGRLLITTNGNHVSTAIVYDFITYAGGFDIASPVASASYGSYAISATIVTSGTHNEIKTIRVINSYTKNANHTGTAAAGPSNPYVSMTMILGATSKGVTVTRPT